VSSGVNLENLRRFIRKNGLQNDIPDFEANNLYEQTKFKRLKNHKKDPLNMKEIFAAVNIQYRMDTQTKT